MSHVLEWVCVYIYYLYCCLAEWDTEMSHADVPVCNGDQQKKIGPYFSKYLMLKLGRSISNVPIGSSTE